MKRRAALVAAVAGGAAALGAGLALWRSRSAEPAPASLWALRVPRPQGGELAFDALRGRPLVVNFWATWCAPCVKEMPELDRFARDFAPQGWQVVGLAIDQADAVREFLRRVPVQFAIGLAGAQGSTLARELGNLQGGLPFTVVLDAGGALRQRKAGATDYAELLRWARAV